MTLPLKNMSFSLRGLGVGGKTPSLIEVELSSEQFPVFQQHASPMYWFCQRVGKRGAVIVASKSSSQLVANIQGLGGSVHVWPSAQKLIDSGY